MSIDARIVGVRVVDGETKLTLEPRDPRGTAAGQHTLVIDNPPADCSGMIGTEIWGSADTIMVGTTPWAKRIGYTHIELLREGVGR